MPTHCRTIGSAWPCCDCRTWIGRRRAGFFTSLALTLNHVHAVDPYCIGALHGEPGLRERDRAFEPAAAAEDWLRRQRSSDLRLVGFCDALDAAALDAVVEMPRADHVQRERAGHVLADLFNHQTHHRGQAHAMLSATGVPPPQLDEFMMPSEAHLRRDDMHSFVWDEAAVCGTDTPAAA